MFSLQVEQIILRLVAAYDGGLESMPQHSGIAGKLYSTNVKHDVQAHTDSCSRD